jgi:membrane protease YdiL (CAAX protease family)
VKSARPIELRDRLGALLRGKFAAAIELLVVPLLLGLQWVGLVSKPKLPLLLFGWLSLWLRRVGWRQVGMSRPSSWPVTVLLASVAGVAYNALDIGVIVPLLQRITGEPLDLTDFAALKGNTETLLLLLTVSWVSAALPEEMLYRGYILNRAADIFGRTSAAWAVNAALASFAFGLAHHSQGASGVIDNVLAGLFFAALYLASGRNLWLPILVHGVIDSTSVVLLYFGFHP